MNRNNYESTSHFRFNDGAVKRDPSRRWSYKGHQMDQFFVSPDRRWAYVNIPKNSSTSIKNALSSIGWEIFTKTEIEHQLKAWPNYLVVLREPKKRWISGIAEYLTMYHSNTISDLNCEHGLEFLPLLGQRLGIGLIFDRFCFDDHTDLQCSFLERIPFNRSKYLRVDNNLGKNLNGFLKEQGYPEVELGTENSAEFGTANSLVVKLQLQNLINLILEKSPDLRGRALDEYLWADYALMDLVKFEEYDS